MPFKTGKSALSQERPLSYFKVSPHTHCPRFSSEMEKQNVLDQGLRPHGYSSFFQQPSALLFVQPMIKGRVVSRSEGKEPLWQLPGPPGEPKIFWHDCRRCWVVEEVRTQEEREKAFPQCLGEEVLGPLVPRLGQAERIPFWCKLVLRFFF